MCFSSPKIPDPVTPQTSKEANPASLAATAAEARRSGATANKQLRTGPGGVGAQTTNTLTGATGADNYSLLGG